MKRVILGLGFVIVAAAAFWGSGITAADRSFEDRFLPNGQSAQTGETGVYNFDKAHTFISFKVKHNGLIYVPGYFRDFTGTVNYDAKDVTKSTVNFTAKSTSIDTGVAGRDTHLRSADFFEVEKFPEVTFKSTKVEKKGKEMVVTGDFTMKGVTKSISIPFSIPGFIGTAPRLRMGIIGETTINRRDFGVNYGSNIAGTSIPVIADEVSVMLQIEATPPRPAPAATQAAN